MNWDKKKKKFIKGDGVGADNVKLVRTENGTRLPASYRSGRFDEWKAKSRVTLPKVGEAEGEARGGGRRGAGPGGRSFRHNKVASAKPLDKLSTDYERKVRQMKKKDEGANVYGGESSPPPSRGGPGGSRGGRGGSRGGRGGSRGGSAGGRYAGKSMARVKTEIKTVDQIRKGRAALEKKRAKNARPSKKGRK